MTIGIKTIVMTKKINFRCCAEEKIRRRRQLLLFLIQIKRKLKRRRKQKRKRGNLRGGREAPPRRLLHPLRFCFRFRFNLRLI